MAQLFKKNSLGLILLAFSAFIAIGLPDGLLGVGWPSIRNGFSISLDSIGMFLTTVIIGYMTASFLSGYLITKLGVGRVLAVSCLLTGLALLGYTIVPQWWMMVMLGVVGGLGAGAIDAGLNTYVAAHFGEELMQWLHASWGVGVTLGPVIMTFGLTAMSTWRFGYQVVGVFQVLLGLCFFLTISMWGRDRSEPAADERKKLTEYKTPMSETLQQPRVWFSVFLFVFYVGAEASLGTWTYTLLTESRGIDKALAGLFAGSYWLTFTIGRIVAGLGAKRIGFNRLIIGGLTGALVGASLLIWNPFELANVMAVGIIGVSIAPIFPAFMSGTQSRVGDHHAANTIGMQMAATGFGMAVVPSLLGVLARRISLEVVPISMFLIFACLLLSYSLLVRAQNFGPVAAPAADLAD